MPGEFRGACWRTASNVLLDTLTVQWNNGQGISFSNPFTNFTVQNTISDHNGDSGFQEFQTLNGLRTTTPQASTTGAERRAPTMPATRAEAILSNHTWTLSTG